MTTRISIALAGFFLSLPNCLLGQGFDPSAIFGGPSVLGRSLGSGISRPSQRVSFRPFFTARGVVDNAFTSTQLDDNGEPITLDLRGYLLSGGVYGSKQFKNSSLTLQVTGGYIDYRRSNRNFYGFNSRSTLGYTQRVGRRAVFNSSALFGTWNRTFGTGFGVTSPLQELDPAIDADIDEDVFDRRVTFFSSMNSLSYSLSPRLSASMNGGFFNTKRASGLISARGTNASGDVAYRLTRRQTISASYGYNEFNFSERYGNSFMQIIGVGYAWDMGNQWMLNLNVRGFRLETDTLQRVAISPEIAAIIGQNVGFETAYRLNYFPGFLGSLSKSFRTMSFMVSAQNTIRPGNGVFMTSRMERYGVGYSYTGIRKWNFGARVGRFERTNLMRFSGSFRTYNGGASVGYQLLPTLQLNAAALYRDILSTTSDNNFRRSGWRYTFGVSFAPGDIPISLF
jgi:hypothetical protein